MSSFKLVTFGCKVNFYESQAMREELLSMGMVEDDNNPDYVMVNTCAVTSVAEKKCVKEIKSIIKNNPNSIIGVVGCSAQISKDRYLAFSNVKVVYGNSNKSEIVKALVETNNRDNVKNSIRHEGYDRQTISSFDHVAKAFVKIQDGCDNFCSYCIIPQTRGNSRSRPTKDVVEEIHKLQSNGYREVILSGIDMGSYYDDSNGYVFSDLLEEILKTFKGALRVRIGSLEESQIDEKTIALFSLYPQTLVPHLHIPLQSGSKEVLANMHRKYDLDAYLELVKKLKMRIPNIALSTDVIVGFPHESEENFKETYDFIEKVGYMRLHVFPYSIRPNTLAGSLKEQIDSSIKQKRVKSLMELGERLTIDYKKTLIGKTMKLLVEEKTSEGYHGYTENYLDITIKGDGLNIGEIYDISLDSSLIPHLIK